MTTHFDNVIHQQAGIQGKMTPWLGYEIDSAEMCVPHYYAVHPFRGGGYRATGAESVGLAAVLRHNGIEEERG